MAWVRHLISEVSDTFFTPDRLLKDYTPVMPSEHP